MIRRPPRSTLDRSSAASDVYKRQPDPMRDLYTFALLLLSLSSQAFTVSIVKEDDPCGLSLIHISEPTRPY